MIVKKLLKLLNDQSADYLIIGAHACGCHGFVRATSDIDILINPSPANIDRVRAALEAFGYDTSDASLKDFQTKKVLFRKYWYDVDIHPSAKGIRTSSAFKNRVPGTHKGVHTYFASLDDLIKMKVAAGRPRDLEDLEYLREIKRQLKKKKAQIK